MNASSIVLSFTQPSGNFGLLVPCHIELVTTMNVQVNVASNGYGLAPSIDSNAPGQLYNAGGAVSFNDATTGVFTGSSTCCDIFGPGQHVFGLTATHPSGSDSTGVVRGFPSAQFASVCMMKLTPME